MVTLQPGISASGTVQGGEDPRDPPAAFVPWVPDPREGLPNRLSTLYFLNRNPIRLLTRRHYSQPFVRNRMFGLSAVFLNDPDMIRHVFVDGRANYGIDPIRKLLLSRNFGRGIATVEGDDWHGARKAASPYFTSRKLEEYGETFLDVACAHCRAVPPSAPVSLVAFVSDITFECAMRCLFSVQADNGFRPAIEANSVCMEKGMTLDLMDIWRMPLGVPRLFKKSLRAYQARYRDHVEAMLRARLDRISRSASGLDDLMTGYQDHYLSDRARDGGVVAALDNIGTMLGAAFDSTTQALAWTVYFLTRSPAAMKAVRDEIDGADAAVAPHLWTARLPRTLAALRETLRVYPTLPAISRYALDDDEIGGQRVRRGEFVVANIWAMHRDPSHWHRASDYLPDRFLPGGDGAGEVQRYMPFGIGPRACIGRHFAEIEAVIVLATLLRSFDFAPAGASPPRPVWRGTLRSDNGIPMMIARRRRFN